MSSSVAPTPMAGLKPGRLDLVVMQGDDLALVFKMRDRAGQPVDVSGWDWRAEVRRHERGLLLAQFALSVGGGLDLHELRCELAATTTWEIPTGSWPWDLVVAEGWPTTRTILAGRLRVLHRATKVE